MISAVVVAAGVGERSGLVGGKQLALIGGIPMVARAVLAVGACDTVDEVLVVCHPARMDEFRGALDEFAPGVVTMLVPGGEHRQESVQRGLDSVSVEAEVIVVHDSARPLVSPDTVTAAIEALLADPSVDGVVCGHPVVDTLKRVGGDRLVIETVDRGELWVAQTPQVFRAQSLRLAHEAARDEGFVGTDDAALLDRTGGRVHMLEAPRENLKITTGDDFILAEALVSLRSDQ